MTKDKTMAAGAAGCGCGRRLVVKIGSSTLTTSESSIDYAYLQTVADQIACVKAAGWKPIVVTSAAIACGLEALGIDRRPKDMPSLQAAASVGQSALSAAYARVFATHGIVTSTVLLTRRDTADRRAYLHARTRSTACSIWEWSPSSTRTTPFRWSRSASATTTRWPRSSPASWRLILW